MPNPQPAYTITTNDGEVSVSTPFQSGWNTAHWVEHHLDDVEATDQPHFDTLETHWLAAGGRVSHETGRDPGESDADFRARHFVDVIGRMASQPPIHP